MTNETGRAEFRMLDIRLDVEIGAPRDAVWRSLTEQIAEWWPAKFYVGRAPRRFAIEPQVGGRVYEDWGDGEGLLFGSVTVYQRSEMLQWVGDMSADYGGPARSVTTFRLTDGRKDGHTHLSFHDTPYGILGEPVLAGLEPGWKWLLRECFLPYAERGERPERPATVERA